ncbi:hypothetical protein ACFP6A_08405 [Quadrisphaera sp. GCM10027208]|uniref:hypothetical protein n=1 Tax=Quadrisphaera sp. GCM10027208 TaxID=3273423 RepID=UPI0036154F9B
MDDETRTSRPAPARSAALPTTLAAAIASGCVVALGLLGAVAVGGGDLPSATGSQALAAPGDVLLFEPPDRDDVPAGRPPAEAPPAPAPAPAPVPAASASAPVVAAPAAATPEAVDPTAAPPVVRAVPALLTRVVPPPEAEPAAAEPPVAEPAAAERAAGRDDRSRDRGRDDDRRERGSSGEERTTTPAPSGELRLATAATSSDADDGKRGDGRPGDGRRWHDRRDDDKRWDAKGSGAWKQPAPHRASAGKHETRGRSWSVHRERSDRGHSDRDGRGRRG